MSCAFTVSRPSSLSRWVLLTAGLASGVGIPLGAQTPQTFSACYVPAVGAIYMIKLPGLPQNCLAPAHKEISWQEGATGAAGGDLAGTYPGPNVVGLRGRALSPAAPVAGQVLVFDGTAWVPATPQAGTGGTAGGDLTGAYPSPTVAKLRGTPLSATTPVDGQVLVFHAGSNSWRPAGLPAGTSDHGALSGLQDDDHPQYLLANGGRPLSGPLGLAGNKITGLGAATAPGDAVRYQQAVKSGDASGGDLAGAYPNPSVVRLQGNALSSIAPTSGQALIWNGAAWAPATPGAPSVGGDISGPLAAATVTALRNRSVSANTPTTGDVLSWSGAAWTPSAPSAPSLGGDLGGTSQSATVLALQNRPVSSTAPTSGQVLTWNGAAWAAAATKALVITSVTQTTSVPGNSSATVTVSCPLATQAISAGWYAQPELLLIDSRREPNGSGWRFEWKSTISAIFNAQSTVYCVG
jgi:hypothetical protein